MEFGKKDMSFRVSGQYLDNQGVIPNNMLEKYNFKYRNMFEPIIPSDWNKYYEYHPEITNKINKFFLY